MEKVPAPRPRRFGRRALLIGGAGVAAVAAFSAPVLISGPVARGRKNLSATECAAALALAETIFPSGREPGMPSATEADVLGRLDEAVGYMHPEIRRLFKLEPGTGMVGFYLNAGHIELAPISVVREKTEYTEAELDKVEKLGRARGGKSFKSGRTAKAHLKTL